VWRVLRWVLTPILALVVVLAVLVGALLVTNPDPRDSPGWERLEGMPSPRGEVAAAATGDALVVMGGLRGLGRASRAVTVYDAARDEWRRGPDLPERRHHAGGAAIGDDIYVAGGATGRTSWTAHRDLWRLRLGENRWEALPDMPEGRYGHQLVALDGLLLVVGGEGGSANGLMIYDPERRAWATQGMPGPRDHLGAVVLDGEIWAIGGRHDDDVRTRVDIYDPTHDEWRRGPALPVPMSAMAAGVIDGAIHVVGGERPRLFGGKVIDRHFVLARKSTRWREAAKPILAVHGAGAGVIDGQLVIAGGARRQGALSVLAWTGVTQAYEP